MMREVVGMVQSQNHSVYRAYTGAQVLNVDEDVHNVEASGD